MATRLVKVPYQGRMVEGEVLDFETIQESWNDYACIDGTRVRVKVVTAKITRLLGEKGPSGETLYAVESTTLISATPPPGQE